MSVAGIAATKYDGRMEAVFVLHHSRYDDEYGEDAKLIGVYRTESGARAATDRLAKQPGFCEHPNGWHIDRYVLDKDHWEEGFFDPE